MAVAFQTRSREINGEAGFESVFDACTEGARAGPGQFSASRRSTRCTRQRSNTSSLAPVIPEIGADRRESHVHRRRPRRSRPRRSLSTIGGQGQRLGPETLHYRSDQTRTAPPLGTAAAGPDAAFISRRLNVLKAHSLTILHRRRMIDWSNRPDYSEGFRHARNSGLGGQDSPSPTTR
jgi:hypothetical protein